MRNWPTIKVADEFDLQMGKTPARDNPAYWGGDQKWASIADIARSGMYLSDTKEAITHEAVSESGIKAVPQNTVVMSFKLSIGRTAITASRMYTNEAIMAFLPHDATAFNLHFLYHLFSNRNWSEGCNKAVKGVTLNKATLNAARIPKPDISEQRAVASTLDKICDLIAKCDEQLVRLNQLVKSRFVQMFGEVKYPERELITVTSFIDYRGKTPTKSDSGIPLITAKNVRANGFSVEPREYMPEELFAEWMTRGFPRVGDVLFTTEAPLGNVCRIPNLYDRFAVGQRIVTMQVMQDVLDSSYLEHALKSDTFQRKIRQKSSGSTVTGIRSKLLEKLTVPIPPLALQREFAVFVAKVDKLAFAARQRRDVAKQLYRAKIQEFFG